MCTLQQVTLLYASKELVDRQRHSGYDPKTCIVPEWSELRLGPLAGEGRDVLLSDLPKNLPATIETLAARLADMRKWRWPARKIDVYLVFSQA